MIAIIKHKKTKIFLNKIQKNKRSEKNTKRGGKKEIQKKDFLPKKEEILRTAKK